MLSEGAGEKPDPVPVGELEWDGGVGRVLGDAVFAWGGGRGAPGSLLGAMLELGRRACW